MAVCIPLMNLSSEPAQILQAFAEWPWPKTFIFKNGLLVSKNFQKKIYEKFQIQFRLDLDMDLDLANQIRIGTQPWILGYLLPITVLMKVCCTGPFKVDYQMLTFWLYLSIGYC